jgi:NADH dehydrogenase
LTRLAVTGANGFVGRHLTRLAGSQGFEVDGVVRSKDAARAAILAGAHPVIVPGLEEASLTRAFKGASAVVHLAQIGAERGGATYEGVNVLGTRAVIAAASAAGVKKVVVLSGLGVARYGMARRCTNRYFLSKLTAEVELYRSGLELAVFRPSYVVGPGGELIPGLVQEMAGGEVEQIGDGLYRLQPIAVKDAAAAILAALSLERSPAAFDLVGPEPMSYREFVERVALAARDQGLAAGYRIREIPVEEAERQAAAGGYRGMLNDELDCLLCDEVADHRPLEALLGRFLTPVHDAIAAVLRAERAAPSA